jgi:hypothetical protein
MREQSALIHDEFSTVLQDIFRLEPIFIGMTEQISAIQGIWQMVSVHFAHLTT